MYFLFFSSVLNKISLPLHLIRHFYVCFFFADALYGSCPGLGKTVVAVVNDLLMDNHQKELADALADRHYLKATTPQELAQTLIDLDDSLSARTPYPQAQPEVFAAIVDEEMCEALGER